MTVFVIGATSQIGHFLLPYLARVKQPVVALSRRTRPSDSLLRWVRGRLPEDGPDPGPFAAIISFGPLEHLATWLGSRRLPSGLRIVATSSMSVDSKRDSSIAGERDQAELLRRGETRLIQACERQSIDWTILRPTLIYGAGLDKSLTPIARRAVRYRIFPIPGGHGLRQPVHAEDVAMAAWRSLQVPGAAGRILPMGGGERLSVEQMFIRVRDSLPVATLPIALPGLVLRTAARIQPVFRGPLQRMDSDLIADNSQLRSLLGLQLRNFLPCAASWGLGGK